MNQQMSYWGCSILLSGLAIMSVESRSQTVTSFQAGDGGWQMGAPAAGNIDADSDLEIIIPYRSSNGRWYLDAFKRDGERLSGFPYESPEPINVSPTLHDLTGNGRDEIIFTAGNQVVALKGDGSPLWSREISFEDYVPDAGFQTVTNGFYWSRGREWKARLPETARFSSEVSSPIIADINGNGSLEVVTAWKIDPDSTSSEQDFNPFMKEIFGIVDWGITGEVWSGGVILLDAVSGEKKFNYHFHQLVESGVALGQVDEDGAVEIFVLNDSDSVVAFDWTQPHGFHGKGMLHKQFGKNQRLLSGSYLTGVEVYTADLDGDGLDEVLVPTTQLKPLWQPHETILDDDGAILWRKWNEEVSIDHQHGWFNNACMIPVNPDRDNRMDVLTFSHSHEIAFRSWNGIELVDRPGWPKNFDPYIPTPPVVGDLDGDGEEEIVIGTYHPSKNPSEGKLYLFRLDGTEKKSIPVPGGIKQIPAIADLDGDGSVELVYRSLAGEVFVANFGANESSRVSWATHRGNMRRDGNFRAQLYPAGTPVVIKKQPGYRRAHFEWKIPDASKPDAFRIYRAEQAQGPFEHLITLHPDITAFTDFELKLGWQYFYEVEAVYEESQARSAPFAIMPDVNRNLVKNGGIEQNDNSHWDKWFSGDLPWGNMRGATQAVYLGKQAMEIKLENHSSQSSITQSSHYGIPESYLPVKPGAFYSFGGFIRSDGLSRPSLHWFEWDSSKTGAHPAERPPLPWPNYFTPHFQMEREPAPWTYANRVFQLPGGFPNVELRHRFQLNGRLSGWVFLDQIFFRELPNPESSAWKPWISFGATWRYQTNPPPDNWQAVDFDDSEWPENRAKFGRGRGPKNVRTSLPEKIPAFYFRRSFLVEEGNFEDLLLAAICTGDPSDPTAGLNVYLNGKEIAAAGIQPVSVEGNAVEYFDLTPFLDRVRPGSNTLAVRLSNSWQPTWDNVAFDLSLRAIPFEPVFPLANLTVMGAWEENVRLKIVSPHQSLWKLESTDRPLPTENWELVERISLNSHQETVVFDSGQNGRVQPHKTPRRFYRLVPD